MSPTTRDALGGRDHAAVVLDRLPDDRSAAIIKIAADLGWNLPRFSRGGGLAHAVRGRRR
jgi:hypothetical protein